VPWESLKAETLRAIHKDLGLPYQGKRDEMVERLREIEANGLDASSKEEEGEDLPPKRVRRKSTRAEEAEKTIARMSSSRSPRRKSRVSSANGTSGEADTPVTRKRRATKAVFDGIDVPATRLLKRRSIGDGDGVATRGARKAGRSRTRTRS